MSTFKIADNVLFQEVDGEAVLLSLDEGCYYGLDELGTRIWKLINQDLDSEQVIAAIVEEYEVEPDQARRDLEAFLGDLEQSGLIEQ
ncbi:MAG: PqqD family protein [Gammaproteobacteria bacterium]|nr:PqqD family protein [Gammaproteobacteria bacterium]